MLRSIVLLLTVCIICVGCGVDQVHSDSKPIDHSMFTSIVGAYVDAEGMVNYEALQKDSASLNAYIDLLANNHPNETYWSTSDQLAYWINAYNAYTLRLIIRNYPLESIKDITAISIPFVYSPWDIKFIEIEGHKYDLNNIEHDIIRKRFDEPRIHFALVCAAKSCPKLRREAYIPKYLDAQLHAQARQFINDPDKNRIAADRAAVSRIFEWYEADFTREGSMLEYINIYAKPKMEEGAEINFMNYDWSLNEAE